MIHFEVLEECDEILFDEEMLDDDFDDLKIFFHRCDEDELEDKVKVNDLIWKIYLEIDKKEKNQKKNLLV
jgi:hypothetical protein